MPIASIDLPRLRRTSAMLAAAAALALGACGGGDDTASGSSSSSGGASESSGSSANDQDAGRVRLQQCLRDNGVDIPDNATQGGAPPTGIDQDKLQEALSGPCERYQQDAFGDVTDADQQELQDQFEKFSACMREQGVDVPEITPGQGGPPGGAQLDTNDPDVRAATEKCQDQLPQGGPGGAGSGGDQ